MYMWYYRIDKFYAMFLYSHINTKSLLFGLELLKYVK